MLKICSQLVVTSVEDNRHHPQINPASLPELKPEADANLQICLGGTTFSHLIEIHFLNLFLSGKIYFNPYA